MENNITLRVEIPGLAELTQAILALAGAGTPAASVPVAPTGNAPAPMGQMPSVAPQQTMVPTSPVPTTPAPVNTTPTAPAPVPTAPIPTTAVPVTHTQDELAIAASQLVNMGKQQRLIEILNGFGVNSLVELPQEKYSAFAGCLKQEGAQF